MNSPNPHLTSTTALLDGLLHPYFTLMCNSNNMVHFIPTASLLIAPKSAYVAVIKGESRKDLLCYSFMLINCFYYVVKRTYHALQLCYSYWLGFGKKSEYMHILRLFTSKIYMYISTRRRLSWFGGVFARNIGYEAASTTIS